MTFVIATGNAHKVEEFRRILAPLGIDAISAAEAGVVFQAEETGSTFEENARIKALAVACACDLPCVADDSGLEVDELGGAPGVYSARYAGEGATDKDRIDKLLGALTGVPEARRRARFVCAVCCVLPDRTSFTVRGECGGRIAFAPQGEGGFGYDPVFNEETTGKSFGALTPAEKDAVSHRGRALAALARELSNRAGRQPAAAQ